MSTLLARITVVGNGDEGTSPSLLLSLFRVTQYSKEEKALTQLVINCGECACRTINEMRIKLTRATHLLVTRLSPQHISGIPSLIFHLRQNPGSHRMIVLESLKRSKQMSMPNVSAADPWCTNSDRGSEKLTVVAPRGISNYMDAIRVFVDRKNPKLGVVEVTGVGNGEGREEQFQYDTQEEDPAPFAWASKIAAGFSVLAVAFNEDEAVFAGAKSGAGVQREAEPPTKRLCVNNGRDVLGLALLFRIRGPTGAGGKEEREVKIVVVDVGSHEMLRGARAATQKWFGDGDEAIEGETSVFHLGPPHVVACHDYAEWCAGMSKNIRHYVLRAGEGIVEQEENEEIRVKGSGGGAGADIEEPGLQEEACTQLPRPISKKEVLTHFPGHTLQMQGLHSAEPALFPLLLPSSKHGPPVPKTFIPLNPLASLEIFPTTKPCSNKQAFLLYPSVHTLERGLPGVTTPAIRAGDVLDSIPDGAVVPCPSILAATPLKVENPEAICIDDDEEEDVEGNTDQQGNVVATPSNSVEEGGGREALHQNAEAKEQKRFPSFASTKREHFVVLGTGAAAPSKLRSCSGILVHLPNGSSTLSSPPEYLLLDVGEGCVGRLALLASRYSDGDAIPCASQLQSHGARKGCSEAAYHSLLRSLRLVWVSHMHADHHTGLLLLLSHRIAACLCSACFQTHAVPPLDIIGPSALENLLHAYTKVIAKQGCETAGYVQRAALYRGDSVPGTSVQRGSSASGFFKFLVAGVEGGGGHVRGLAGLISVRVDHCRDSFGAVLTMNSCAHRKMLLCYSGDTRPCSALVGAVGHAVRVCRGACDVVLVHEATMNDDRAQDAHKKKHSTVGGALSVASGMANAVSFEGGRFLGTVLTHFSQRYPSIPLSAGTAEVSVAGQVMTEREMVRVADVQKGQAVGIPRVIFAFDGLCLPLDALKLDLVLSKSEHIMARLAAVRAKHSLDDDL